MSKFLRVSVLGLASLLVVSAGTATAASIIFSGADVGGGVGGPRVNSDGAHASWLVAVAAGTTIETFEGIALGTSSPIALAGGMTLTTVGGPVGAGFELNQVTNNQNNQLGYNTTGGGENYFRFAPEFGGTATMTITFADPLFAFGLYVTGIQNGFGLTTASWGADSFQLVDTQGAPNIAGVQFFGFVSDVAIGSITFRTVAATPNVRDVMGFDDIEIATAVPEPATVALVVSGLVGMAARRRRRR